MSKKRFTVMKKFDGSYVICDNGKMLVAVIGAVPLH